MITEVDWRGDLDGEVVLTLLGEAGVSERVIDRPGDLVSTMMAEEFVEARRRPSGLQEIESTGSV